MTLETPQKDNRLTEASMSDNIDHNVCSNILSSHKAGCLMYVHGRWLLEDSAADLHDQRKELFPIEVSPYWSFSLLGFSLLKLLPIVS